MLRRALAAAALLAVLGLASPAGFSGAAFTSTPPVFSPAGSIASTPAAASTIVPVPTSTPILGPVLHPPLRNRIATDPPPTVEDAKAWALATLGPREFSCLDRIVWHESRWNPLVWNTKGSGAYGLPQARPGSKMSSAGDDWLTNPITQLRWAIGYATHKYRSLCGAWAFWVDHGWW
jgi:hypothetical protein